MSAAARGCNALWHVTAVLFSRIDRLMTEKQIEEKLQSGSKRREPNNHFHAFWQTLYNALREACGLQIAKREGRMSPVVSQSLCTEA